MKQEVKNLEDKVLKEVSLEKSIFGLEPKDTIIHRMINYQLSKRRSGNHKTKGISKFLGQQRNPLNKKERGVPVREVDRSANERWSSHFWSSS